MRHVLMVNGSELERVGLRAILREIQPHLVIREADCFVRAREALLGSRDIDVVVIDFAMPCDEGVSAFFKLQGSFPLPAYVLICDEGDGIDAGLVDAIGAARHIVRSFSKQEIVAVLSDLLVTEPDSNVTGAPQILSTLSPAQVRILKGLQRGMRNKQIAFEMGVTENTVRTYLSSMYRRLGVSSRTEALFLLRDALSSEG